MAVIAIDGVIGAEDRAMVSVFDRGFLYGDGLFEILRTWNRIAADLELHLDRLCASAIELHMEVDRQAIARMVADVLAASAGEQRLRIVVTSDHDVRVAPLHSYKFAAALQAAQGGPAPVLLHVEVNTGHGESGDLSKRVEQEADILAFAAKFLGMDR